MRRECGLSNTNKEKTKKKHRWIIPVVIVGLTGVLIAMGVINAGRQAREALANIETVQLQRIDLAQTLLVSGTVHSNSRQEIYAPSSLEILDVLVQQGSEVKQGDVLALLDTSTLQLDIRSAELNIESAEQALGSTQRDLGTSTATANNSVASSRIELENARRTYNEAKLQAESQPSAAVQSAKAELDIAQRKYDEQQREGMSATSVQSAKAELDIAQRKYDDMLSTAMKSATVQNAKMDYDTAQKNYARLVNDGDDAAIKNAWTAYTTAKDQLVTTITVNEATVKNADTVAKAKKAAYEAALAANQNQDDPAVKLAKMEMDVADNELASATASRVQATKQAQLNIDTTYQQYETTIKSQDDAVESAWNAREKARLNYESAIKNADESIVAAKDTLDRAALSYDSAVKAINDSLVNTKDALDRAAISYESALKNQSDALVNAQTALQRAQTSYDGALINQKSAQGKNADSARISLEQQRIALEKMQSQLNNATIIAPMDGTITFLNAGKGEYAAGLMFVLEDASDLTVKTTVGETEVGALVTGQDALVRTDGTGADQFAGKVSFISPAAQKNAAGETSDSTNVQFGLNVDITQKDPRVRIGMNARLTIMMENKADVLAAPIEAITSTDQGDVLYALVEGQWTAVPVTLGLQNDTMVEVSGPDITDGMTIAAYGNPLEGAAPPAIQAMAGMRGRLDD